MEGARQMEHRPLDGTQKPYANPSEWEKHRERIGHLYKNCTLNALMEIMEREHGFRATAKMYKGRLAKWKMTTKYKKHSPRQTRRGRAQSTKLDTRNDSKPPALMLQSSREVSPQVCPRILKHINHDGFESIFGTIDTYFRGSLEARTWTVKRKRLYSKKASGNDGQLLESFYRYAQIALVEKCSRETEYLLIVALAPLTRLLRAESPFLIVNLLRLAAKSSIFGNDQLLVLIFRHIYTMSKTIHGHLHPVTKLCLWVSKFGSDVQLHLLQRCLDCIISVLESRAGAPYISTTRIRKYRLAFEPGASNANIAFTAIETSDNLNGKADTRTLNLQMIHIQKLLQDKNRNSWQDAVDLSSRSISTLESLHWRVAAGWRSIFLALQSDAYRLLNLPSQAQEAMQQSIENGETGYGKYHGRVLLYLLRYEKRLLVNGKVAEASNIQRERIARINSMLQQALV